MEVLFSELLWMLNPADKEILKSGHTGIQTQLEQHSSHIQWMCGEAAQFLWSMLGISHMQHDVLLVNAKNFLTRPAALQPLI